LLPEKVYRAMKSSGLRLAVEPDCGAYLPRRIGELDAEFSRVDRLAQTGQLQDASIIEGVLKLAPLHEQEPDEAELLTRQSYALLPRIKITDLLVEVDEWSGFTRHFTHLRNGEAAEDRALLLTAILADGINLGLTRMAEASPGIPLAMLSRVAARHIREETYTKALAEVVNHHHRIAFTGH
jgi:hypothetical protein